MQVNGTEGSSSFSPMNQNGENSNSVGVQSTTMMDSGYQHEQQQPTQVRRRLVQGRPPRPRVVSDTNSEISSSSLSDMGDEPSGIERGPTVSNGQPHHPQIAMKTPRTHFTPQQQQRQPPPSSDKQQQQQSHEFYTSSLSSSSSLSSDSEMAADLEDDEFTMSDIDEELKQLEEEDDLEDLDDFSDEDWGQSKATTPRKRKTKTKKSKTATARSKNKRAKPAAPPAAAPKQDFTESSSSDSDFFTGSSSRRKKKTMPAKRRLTKGNGSRRKNPFADGSDSEYGSSDYRSLRQSTRDSAVKSYAEDATGYPGVDFEDELAEDMEVVDKGSMPTSSSKAAVANTPLIEEDTGEDVIEQIRDFRIVAQEEGKPPKPMTANDIDKVEFYVKWKGWSFRNATWDKAEFLKTYKGYKKVENYFKSTVLVDNAIRTDPDITREDLEQLDINHEMERDTLKDYMKIERIIATRPLTQQPHKRLHENDTTTAAAAPESQSDQLSATTNANTETATATQADESLEYLVKWKRLPYSACSWIMADEIGQDGQPELDAFLDREQSLCLAHRGASTSQHKRPKFQRMVEQPDYLARNGELRDYQLTSLNWMAHLWSIDENGILADEMGLGKTIQTISFLSYLFHTQHIYGPFLVVVPLSTIGSWQREFARWAPDLNTLCYIDDNRSRAIMREFEFYKGNSNPPKIKFNVLLTTYELVLKDRSLLGSIKWNFLAVDEAHRLKNSESQLHEALSSFHTTNRLLVTGTPLQNTVKELVTLCKFLTPERFADLSDDFDIRVAAGGDNEQERKIAELHRRLKPYMLRRLKKDVEKSLPHRTERILRVELSGMQVHYYKNILTRNYSALNRNATGAGQMSLLNIMVELKKASNHPYLFPNAETQQENKEQILNGLINHSGKMVLLDKLLTKLKDGGHRVLIFSQMVRMLDILADYMAMRGYAYQRLDGSVPSEIRKRSIEHFNAPGSPDFVFLLSTRAGGLGINLETADTVILYDSDFNPQADMQAMARAHRIGQKKQVSVYRFVSKNTIEEDILERAKRKMVLEYCIIKGMDTSGLHVTETERKQIEKSKQGKSGGIVGSSTGNASFSREELAAILKFGASSMFADDSVTMQQHRLDDMDLDKMLEDAEQADTSEVGVADDFLSQFKVADYGGSAGMSWDEIIPEDERQRVELEEQQKKEEELLFRRRRARVSYAEDGTQVGALTNEGDVYDVDGMETIDDSDAMSTVSSNARGGGNGRRRRRGGTSDPKAFTEKEVRALIRGMQKFGSPAIRFDQVVAEAELESKDPEFVRMVGRELIKSCEDAMGGNHNGGTATDTPETATPATAGQDDEDINQLALNAGGKKSGKATLLTFRGVHSVNAGVVLQRVADLEVLVKRMEQPQIREDPTKFRIGVLLKPVHHWSCLWGQREDAMLLVGIYRHGFGNWDKIQADTELGLQKKLFLTAADEKAASMQTIGGASAGASGTVRASSVGGAQQAANNAKRIVAPKSTHLVRRGDYLLKVLREGAEKKSQPVAPPTAAPLPLPSPPVVPDAPANGEISAEEPESMDERTCKDLMRPVKRYLQRLRDEAEHTKSANGKVKLISECLLPIGRHIRSVIERKRRSEGGEDLEALNRHLWIFVSYFWRTAVEHTKLIRLFERLEESNLSKPQDAPQSPVASPTTIKRQHSSSSHHHHHHGRRRHSASKGGDRSRSREGRRRQHSVSKDDYRHGSESHHSKDGRNPSRSSKGSGGGGGGVKPSRRESRRH